MKRYTVYIEVDDFVPIVYGHRHFKITAWLLTKRLNIYGACDLIHTYIYDRKKGDVVYEK